MRLAEGQVGVDDTVRSLHQKKLLYGVETDPRLHNPRLKEPTLVVPDRPATPTVHSPTHILTAIDLLPFPPPLASPPASPSPFKRTLSLLSPRKPRRPFSTAAATASSISPLPHARTRSLDLLTRPFMSPFKTRSFDLPRPILVPLELSSAQSGPRAPKVSTTLPCQSPPTLDPPTSPPTSPPALSPGQARGQLRRRTITTRPYNIPSLKEDLNVQAAILALASSGNKAERHVLCRLGISVDEECGACRSV